MLELEYELSSLVVPEPERASNSFQLRPVVGTERRALVGWCDVGRHCARL